MLRNEFIARVLSKYPKDQTTFDREDLERIVDKLDPKEAQYEAWYDSILATYEHKTFPPSKTLIDAFRAVQQSGVGSTSEYANTARMDLSSQEVGTIIALVKSIMAKNPETITIREIDIMHEWSDLRFIWDHMKSEFPGDAYRREQYCKAIKHAILKGERIHFSGLPKNQAAPRFSEEREGAMRTFEEVII